MQCFLARDKQKLLSHLEDTARMASSLSEPYGLGYTAYVCGILHDIGKYSRKFQDYLLSSLQGKEERRGEVTHSWQGAKFLLDSLTCAGNPSLADLLANVIASHHGSLTNQIENSERVIPQRLDHFSAIDQSNYEEVLSVKELKIVLEEINWKRLIEEYRCLISKYASNGKFALHLCFKFLYSCLVDSDRSNAAGLVCEGDIPNWNLMESYLEEKLKKLSEKSKETLSKVRSNISSQMVKQADRPSGIFTLSVPTGGGKTLASLRFAIRHAQVNKLKRIVYIIPYLSIIDQTAREFREIFGENAEDWILEHHSNFTLESNNENAIRNYESSTQRWDTPIIVTTMVQFLESVVSNKASDLRKFHNMMQSVFIFDEVQAIPVKCVHLFNLIVNFLHTFGQTSCVLCSATQPTLTEVERPIDLSKDSDLVFLSSEEKALFHRTNLVDKTSIGLTSKEIAQLAINQKKNTLVVLNTKRDARAVFESLDDNCLKYFLSTDLCPAHRLHVIDQMSKKLNRKEETPNGPIICVSTQLIEAGVDISFDCVIRAVAGLDSIIQAAGRCNRHGQMKEPQDVIVVCVANEKLAHLPEIELGKQLTLRIIREEGLNNPSALSTFYKYKFGQKDFKNQMDYPVDNPLYGTLINALGQNSLNANSYADAHNGDKYKGLPSAFLFAAEAFSVIEGNHKGIVVPYSPTVLSLIEEFKQSSIELSECHCLEEKRAILMRRSRILKHLQQYTVSVHEGVLKQHLDHIECIEKTFNFLSADFYDQTTGLTLTQGFLSI